MARDKANQNRMRARVAKQQPACHICGSSIDYALPHTDKWSFVIDHVIPLAKGGEDALANVKAAHRHTKLQQHEESPPRRTDRQTKRLPELDRINATRLAA
mgnify:FL=1